MQDTRARHSNRTNILMWLVCVFFLFWHLGPVLSNQQLAGWDLTSHYYLFTKMLGYLSEGRVSGYDTAWYAGYPAFTLYPPLFYVFAALPYFLTGGLLTTQFSFNLSLFLIPLLFLFGIWFAARECMGKRAGAPGLLFALLFLALPRDFVHFSVGLLGLFAMGLPASYFATSLYAILLGLLERVRRQPDNRKALLFLTFTIAAIILSHLIVALFAAWTLLLYILFRERVPRIRIFLCSLSACLLSIWWWLPMLRALPYSSGVSLGLPGEQPDPLLVFLPKLFVPGLLNFLTTRVHYLQIPYSELVLPFPSALIFFPWLALFFTASLVIAVYSLIHHRRIFFPALFIVSLILLPRNILTEVAKFGVHTYRFVQPIFVLEILLCAYGFARLQQWANTFSNRVRIPLTYAGGGLVAIAGIVACFLTFSMEPQTIRYKDPYKENTKFDLTYRFPLTVYREAEDAAKILSYLAEHPPLGRIAVDTADPLFARLGSPHYFSSQIPLLLGHAVVPGLLAESALSAGFINPTLHGLSTVPGWTDYMVWGRNYLVGLHPFRTDHPDLMIERLKIYGIEYIVSALQSSSEALGNSRLTKLVLKSGSIGLYQIKDFRSIASESTYKPFLFLEQGGISFREFAEQWYAEVRLIKRPIIFNPKQPSAYPSKDNDKLGGYIVSWGSKNSPSQADYDFWAAQGKPVIFLNSSPLDLKVTAPNVVFVPSFGPWSGHERFSELFMKASSEEPWRNIPLIIRQDEHLSFDSSESILVNYSYFPRWKAESADQIVYWATPSMMFLFGNGTNVLRYQR